MSLGKMGRGFGRLSLLSGGGGGFDLVRDVFGGGAYAGLYYDFTSLTQIGGLDPLWRSSAGSPVVTASGNTVGLALSPDQGPTLGGELLTNGNFGTGDATGWTLAGGTAAVADNVVTLTNVGTKATLSQSCTTVVGATYRVDLGSIADLDSGAAAARVRVTSNNTFSGTTLAEATSSVADGYLYFRATTTTSYLWLGNNVATDGLQVAFGGVSLMAVSGNHAYQSTTGSRGTWSSDGYWLGDGSDDHLISGLLPGNDMTIIAAIYPTAASDAVAGTMAASDTRSLGFGTDASGNLTLMLGDASLSTSTIKGSTDIRNAWSVASAIGAGTTGTLRRNGAQIATGTVGGSINTTIAYLIGAFNSNGTPAATLAGRIARILIVKRSNMSAGLIANVERAIGAGFVSL